MKPALRSCLFLLTLLAAGGVADAVAATTARSLGIVSPRGGDSVANDMNAAGQVAAVIADDNGTQRGVLFQNGQTQDLGTLGGTESVATRINERGEIVGSARTKDGGWHAVVYDRTNGLHDLGTLGGPASRGEAINNAGTAVGYADTANGDWHAFLYQPDPNDQHSGHMQDLGTLGGKISYASGINNHGQVVGTATLANDYKHAFLYDPLRGMTDLGTLGGRISTATAINDDGMIVGASETRDHRWHAFVYNGVRMIDLGAIIGKGDSFATGINNAGHVVGSVSLEDSRMSFVWRDNKMMLHQSSKGLYLTNAINDKEQVIGATFSLSMNAATMSSSAAPLTDHGGVDLALRVATVLLLASAMVILRKRYRGILINLVGERGMWAKYD
ncbi:MAG TPA: HAF repeat-containing protein [Burkholderiaceae bacterium]|jgi:probable HAF family extracellular repeat protein|nr:HAF repeat-containing protein [Burkholderiaceae bacterium]